MQKPAVTVMVKAARLAGNVLLRSINKLDALNVVQKDRMDYASEVDADAEKVIVKELRRAYPDYAVVGEEGGIQGQSRYTWVIDPLDGTSNYLRGFPHYCVSIALVENGEPTDAVIFDPLRNDLFTASRGAGAQLNERKDPGGRAQGPGRHRHQHRLSAARARPRRRPARMRARTAGPGRGRAPHRFGRAGSGLRGLRPPGRLFRSRREGLGHRRRRAAGTRSRRPHLRISVARPPRAWTAVARLPARSSPATSRWPTPCRRPSSTPATPPASTRRRVEPAVEPSSAPLYQQRSKLRSTNQKRPRDARPFLFPGRGRLPQFPHPESRPQGLRASAASSLALGIRSCLVTFMKPMVSSGQAMKIEEMVPITMPIICEIAMPSSEPPP